MWIWHIYICACIFVVITHTYRHSSHIRTQTQTHTQIRTRTRLNPFAPPVHPPRPLTHAALTAMASRPSWIWTPKSTRRLQVHYECVGVGGGGGGGVGLLCLYVRICPNNIFWRSWFFENDVRIFKSEARCLGMINFTSSFRAKKFMINDVLKYSSSTAIQYLYNMYKRQVFKPFSKWFFLKQIMKWFAS